MDCEIAHKRNSVQPTFAKKIFCIKYWALKFQGKSRYPTLQQQKKDTLTFPPGLLIWIQSLFDPSWLWPHFICIRQRDRIRIICSSELVKWNLCIIPLFIYHVKLKWSIAYYTKTSILYLVQYYYVLKFSNFNFFLFIVRSHWPRMRRDLNLTDNNYWKTKNL